MKLNVNGAILELDADPDMPLLWALRDLAGVLGPKFGCGIGACGACTVLIDGKPERSCAVPIGAVTGIVTTVEGMAEAGGALHILQQAWIDEQVAQCGYCQSGQLMSAAALLAANPKPTDAEIDEAMAGNLCRCGTYPRIRAAIKRAAGMGA